MVAVQRLYQPAKKDTKDFDGIDISSDPCLLAKEPAQLHCDLPCCEACQCAKARKKSTGSKTMKVKEEKVDTIRADDLKPGERISVDQYESSIRGRRLETRGQERQSYRYCGGTLFYNHASGRLFNYHQIS